MNWRIVLFFSISIPISLVLAFICVGIALQHDVRTPGMVVWGLFHSAGRVSKGYADGLGIWILIDALCLEALFGGAYILARKLGPRPGRSG
jgi:hypothetical protein